MKTKKFEKKLQLSKRTIADLHQAELHSVKAGGTETLNPSYWPTCQLSAQCETFCLGNCETHEYPTCPGGTDTCP